MPSSSSVLTRLASVNRGGGLVEWPSTLSSFALTAWSLASRGSRDSASSASPPASESTASTYALRKPAKVMVRPEAEKVHSSPVARSEEHTSELQSHSDLVCRLLLEKKNKKWRRSE